MHDFVHLELWQGAKTFDLEALSVTFSLEANEINTKSNVLASNKK